MIEFNRDFCEEKHRHIENTLERHEERLEKLEDVVFDLRSLIRTIKWLTGVILTAVIGLLIYIIQFNIMK